MDAFVARVAVPDPVPTARVLVEVEPRAVRLSVPGIPGGDGPPGLTGPPGPVGGRVVMTSTVVISGHRGVRSVDGTLMVASVDELGHADTCFGVTTGGAQPGSEIEVQVGGVLTESTWSWQPGPVYLGVDGALTQTPVRAAFEQCVGIAVGPTAILVAIQPAIILPT